MEGGAFLGCLQDGGMTRCCCFLSGFNEAQNDASGGKGKGISWARAVQQALMSCPSFCLDSAPAAPSPAAFLNCIWSDLSNVDSTRWNRSRIPLFCVWTRTPFVSTLPKAISQIWNTDNRKNLTAVVARWPSGGKRRATREGEGLWQMNDPRTRRMEEKSFLELQARR